MGFFYMCVYIYMSYQHTKKETQLNAMLRCWFPKTLMPLLLRPYLDPKIYQPHRGTLCRWVSSWLWFELPILPVQKVSRKIRDKSQLIGQPSKNHTSVYLSGCFTGFSKNGNICLLILTLTQLSRNSLGHEDGFWCSLNYQVWLSVIQWNQKGNKHFQQINIDEYRILDVYQFHVYFGIPWKTLSCLHGNHLLHRHLLCFILSSSHHGDHSQGVAFCGVFRIKQKSYSWSLPKKWYDSLCFVEIYLWLKCLVAEIPIQCSKKVWWMANPFLNIQKKKKSIISEPNKL